MSAKLFELTPVGIREPKPGEILYQAVYVGKTAGHPVYGSAEITRGSMVTIYPGTIVCLVLHTIKQKEGDKEINIIFLTSCLQACDT